MNMNTENIDCQKIKNEIALFIGNKLLGKCVGTKKTNNSYYRRDKEKN